MRPVESLQVFACEFRLNFGEENLEDEASDEHVERHHHEGGGDEEHGHPGEGGGEPPVEGFERVDADSEHGAKPHRPLRSAGGGGGPEHAKQENAGDGRCHVSDDFVERVENTGLAVEQRDEGDSEGDGGDGGDAADEDELLVAGGGAEAFDNVITDHCGDRVRGTG